jgi:hypothetical protein
MCLCRLPESPSHTPTCPCADHISPPVFGLAWCQQEGLRVFRSVRCNMDALRGSSVMGNVRIYSLVSRHVRSIRTVQFRTLENDVVSMAIEFQHAYAIRYQGNCVRKIMQSPERREEMRPAEKPSPKRRRLSRFKSTTVAVDFRSNCVLIAGVTEASKQGRMSETLDDEGCVL